MKKLYVFIAALFLFTSLNSLAYSAENNATKLLIVCTTADQQVYEKMVIPYATFAKQQKWFDEVEILFWGPCDVTIAENPKAPETMKSLTEKGVKLTACKWCAEQYGVAEKLSAMGIDVQYMGQPLSDKIKGGWKVLTF